MKRGFDIMSVHKTKRKTKSQPKKQKKLNSALSWILIIVITIVATSFLTSTQQITKNGISESSIDTQVLADEQSQKVIEDESKKEITNSASKNTGINLENATEQKDPSEIQNNINSNQDSSLNTLDKLELKIKVLNGSGETKMAANVKKLLEKGGYIIAKIDTANNIYATTVIYCNKDNEKQASQISQDLDVNAKTDINSKITGKYDYVIVVGKDYIAKTQN